MKKILLIGLACVLVSLKSEAQIVISPTSPNGGPITPSSVTTPLVIGGTGVTSTLTLQSTSGVGSSDAIIFKVGNNGATEGLRIKTDGSLWWNTDKVQFGIGSGGNPYVYVHGALGNANGPGFFADVTGDIESRAVVGVNLSGVGELSFGQGNAARTWVLRSVASDNTASFRTPFYWSDGTNILGRLSYTGINGNPAIIAGSGKGFTVYTNDAGTTALSISSSGAATFSSSVSAASNTSGPIAISTDVTSISGTANFTGVNDASANTNQVLISYGNNASGAGVQGYKTRAATSAASTIVQNGDVLFGFSGRGADGTSYGVGGGFRIEVDGAPGAGSMPGRWVFLTTPSGSTTAVERWRITSSGHFLAGTDNTYDIGAAGATRPRTINAGTSVVTPLVNGSTSAQLSVVTANAILSSGNSASGVYLSHSNGSTTDGWAMFGTGRTWIPTTTTNTQDIGATANLIRTGYFGTSVVNTNATNGQAISDLQTLTELTTIAAAATTDTVIQMPANSVVLGVAVRVTTVIPTATTFTVGDSGSAARFSTAGVSVAANSTDPGTKAGAYYNASALSIRLTMVGGTPAANTGRVRVVIYYYTVTPPSS